MQKNKLYKNDTTLIRVLELKDNQVLVVDCIKRTMPKWITSASLKEYLPCDEADLWDRCNVEIPDIEDLDNESKEIMYKRYTMIAAILPFIGNEKVRCQLIQSTAAEFQISKQTIRSYLCKYAAYQKIEILAPTTANIQKELSQDEKNIRWSLNKFFYNKNQISLKEAYTLMLKHKYCDTTGQLLPEYPSFYQFRYFYRKTRKLQNYYISRDGIKNYQRNNRPLLGDGVQEYAPNVGMGMLDATICDIYLVNEGGYLVGRPILTACIDAYSGLCCGYSLSWEGGVYSLRNLMLNIITDKVEWCKKFGIIIDKKQWDSKQLPALFVTDMGAEYKSETFEQISELGVTIVNLPPYRPELKGSVEKFFDLIQDSFKPYLKGKGLIEPDFRERGSHDYRKDACLTMHDFEKIILKCIIYYNSKRVVENYPYTDAMIQANVAPYACDIWEWGKSQDGANLISIEKESLILSLLPRTTGKFSRYGLKVNQMRYKHENYTEKYLAGGTVEVAYNPEDVSYVWLIEKGSYIRFELIENRYKGKDLSTVENLKEGQRKLVKTAANENTQAKIDLARYIETIVTTSATSQTDVQIKEVRSTRQREQIKTHIDFMKVGKENE